MKSFNVCNSTMEYNIQMFVANFDWCLLDIEECWYDFGSIPEILSGSQKTIHGNAWLAVVVYDFANMSIDSCAYVKPQQRWINCNSNESFQNDCLLSRNVFRKKWSENNIFGNNKTW